MMGNGKYIKKIDFIRMLFIIEFLILLALIPGCFRRERLIGVFCGDEIPERTVQAEDHLRFCTEELTLTPGVYQIRVWTKLAESQSMYVKMECGSAFFKALRNNGMTIFPGNDYQDFNVYVSDKISSAYVQCDFFGTGSEGVIQLEVWKTALGCRMLLFILLVFFAALDFLLLFRRRILDGKVSKRRQIVFWVLSAGILAAYFPYLTDYFFDGDDANFHLARIAYLAESLKQGASLPVRIEGTWMYGHGYASSMFYGDLFLLFPAFLCIIGFSVMTAYKMFVLSVTIATAAIAYHSFKKCVKDEYAALFGSMIYLLAPYRIYDVYSRFAVGEYLALAFLPMVFCGMYLLYTEDTESIGYRKHKWYIILGMSALLQSHLISTEMTAFLLVVSAIVFWKRTFRKQTFFQLLQAAGTALLMNAWFWLPMLYMLNSDSYHLEAFMGYKMQPGGMRFGNFFFWLPYSSYDYGSRGDVWIGAGAALLLLFYAVWRYRRRERDTVCKTLAIFSVLGLIMSTAYFPWDTLMKIPGIGYMAASLEFPWRWLSPVTLFIALLGAFLFRQVMERGGMYPKAALGVIAGVTLATAFYHVGDILLEAAPFYLYNIENIGTIHVGGNGEYLLTETQISEVNYHKPIAEEGLLWSEYEKNGTNITIFLNNRSRDQRHIEIPLTGYKGYGVTASDSGSGVPFLSEERGAHGDLQLTVPAGYQGTVHISYKGLPLFRVADTVSLVSLAMVFGIYFYRKRAAAGRPDIQF